MFTKVHNLFFKTNGIRSINIHGFIFLNYGSIFYTFPGSSNIPRAAAARHCALFRMTSPILPLETPGIEIGLNRFAKARRDNPPLFIENKFHSWGGLGQKATLLKALERLTWQAVRNDFDCMQNNYIPNLGSLWKLLRLGRKKRGIIGFGCRNTQNAILTSVMWLWLMYKNLPSSSYQLHI